MATIEFVPAGKVVAFLVEHDWNETAFNQLYLSQPVDTHVSFPSLVTLEIFPHVDKLTFPFASTWFT